jgi:hypothetical protein
MSAPASVTTVDESFGRGLRRERERRQIALASIAENTKINVSLFHDLERDDVTRWPSGIFRKAFIRAYAEAVGLDAEAITHEFLERFPDPNEPGRRSAETTAAPKPALLVTVADTSSSFATGRILASLRSRWGAIGCDAAIVVTLGLTLYMVLGSLWMPLCLALVGYYAGAILLLGNTPGVCLCAPVRGPNSPRRTNLWRQVRSYVATLTHPQLS